MDKMTGIRACRKRAGSPDAPAQSGKIPFPGQVSGTDFIHKQKRRKRKGELMEYRIEHDVLGEVKVPADACWMSQTQRSLENI